MLNKKGLAVSSIIYSILVLFILLLLSVLGILGARKLVFDKFKSDVMKELDGNSNFVEEIYPFEYTGLVQTKTMPANSTCTLEVWGASGGSSYLTGTGGYSTGIVRFSENTELYVYVGGVGSAGTGSNSVIPGGFNGGGNAYGYSDGNNGSGGGATDIRIGSTSLYSRIIVAGGGGGSVAASGSAEVTPQRGYGGGSTGISGISNYSTGYVAAGGTQIVGGTGSSVGFSGTFGQGGNGEKTNRASGGGGWYGGGSTYIIGGGGSGWVYTADTYATWLTGNPTDAAGWLLNSSYYLSNAKTIAGNDPNMPVNPDTTGNGYARITCN